jgi:AraC family transcriptional regulator, ethanolamine operon transcriptional activator
MTTSCRSNARRPKGFASRQEVVERAEAYLHTHRGDAIPLSRLCRMIGLSERGLRNAFYTVRGMSPKRCMLLDRLQGVRHTLSDQCSRPTSVTGVATAFGFYELGRFSAIYKREFGEAPSETLRATIRKSATNDGRSKGPR